MKRGRGSNEPSMSGRAEYLIQVRGTVPRQWIERLGGMVIEKLPDSSVASDHTVLRGSVRDQAELTGILATLYELHLPVVSVEWLPTPSERPFETEAKP